METPKGTPKHGIGTNPINDLFMPSTLRSDTIQFLHRLLYNNMKAFYL